MKTYSKIVSVALISAVSLACQRSKGERQEEGGVSRVVEEEICVVAPVGREFCRPNTHLFFSEIWRFSGMNVSVSAYAIYSPRGSLLIYPSSASACDSLDYSGIEVFLREKISEGVKDRIQVAGLARVLVSGKVSAMDGAGAMPVIGRIDDASVALSEGASVVLRKNPKELVRGDYDESYYGVSAQPSCLKI